MFYGPRLRGVKASGIDQESSHAACNISIAGRFKLRYLDVMKLTRDSCDKLYAAGKIDT